MRYPNHYYDREEVKVAVLVDEMRADTDAQRNLADLIWGCAALAAAGGLFLLLH